MRKLLRGMAISVGGVMALLAAASLLVLIASEVRLQRRYAVPTRSLAFEGDPASIERGRHLTVAVCQCNHCHGYGLEGRPAVDDPLLGRLYAPNLTAGLGGIGATYSDADFDRAIRHGVNRQGRALAIMPAQYLRTLGDRDLADMIAYLRSVPPVDRETPSRKVGFLSRLVLVTGLADELLPAEEIDHGTEPERAPDPTISVEYGRYLVDLGSCRVCHHADLTGGAHPLAVPGEPVPPDLGPGGALVGWSADDFVGALRSGVTRDGRQLDHRYMPWPYIGQLSDAELRAIWLYVASLAPGEGEQRVTGVGPPG